MPRNDSYEFEMDEEDAALVPSFRGVGDYDEDPSLVPSYRGLDSLMPTVGDGEVHEEVYQGDEWRDRSEAAFDGVMTQYNGVKDSGYEGVMTQYNGLGSFQEQVKRVIATANAEARIWHSLPVTWRRARMIMTSLTKPGLFNNATKRYYALFKSNPMLSGVGGPLTTYNGVMTQYNGLGDETPEYFSGPMTEYNGLGASPLTAARNIAASVQAAMLKNAMKNIVPANKWTAVDKGHINNARRKGDNPWSIFTNKQLATVFGADKMRKFKFTTKIFSYNANPKGKPVVTHYLVYTPKTAKPVVAKPKVTVKPATKPKAVAKPAKKVAGKTVVAKKAAPKAVATKEMNILGLKVTMGVLAAFVVGAAAAVALGIQK